MPKLRRLAGRDVLTILQGFGFQQVSQRGSHVKLVREVAGSRQVLTVPLHTELDPARYAPSFAKPVASLPSKTSDRISIHKDLTCDARDERENSVSIIATFLFPSIV